MAFSICLTDPAIRAAFDEAVRNVTVTNLIPFDEKNHNSTRLLDREDPAMIRAGGGYDTPWTRDSAVNTWMAGRFLVPRAARNTLFAVCVPDGQGQPIIILDNQVWDRIVWAVGAWQYYLATGEEDFLKTARDIVARGLGVLHGERFVEATGLYAGGSFFNDGISGYPQDIYEPGMDHSFMGMHPKTETIQCLSTNCIYCEAWRILDRMNSLLGIRDPEPGLRHQALKEAICRGFGTADGSYGYLIYPDGRRDDSQELAGICFGVLFGILPPRALEKLHREPAGYPSIWPPFPGLFSLQRPGRHNNLIWPFLNGFYILAAAGCGMEEAVGQELSSLADMANRSGGFYEIYDARDGSVNGGWQIGGDDLQGHLWESCPEQTWSAAGFIGGVLQGVFGIVTGEEEISFAPCVPEALRDSRLEGLTLRGKTLNIRLSGWGSRVKETWINGQRRDTARISLAEAEDGYDILLTMEN